MLTEFTIHSFTGGKDKNMAKRQYPQRAHTPPVAAENATTAMVVRTLAQPPGRFGFDAPELIQPISRAEAKQVVLIFDYDGPNLAEPSARDIRRQCAEIRKGWTARERQKRRERAAAMIVEQMPF